MGAPSVPARSNRRAMIILAVGGGALLLFFLVTKVLGGGGGGDDLSAPITVPNRPGVSPGTSVAPGPPPQETFEVFSSKNPFTPLVGGTGTGTGTTSGGTTATTLPGGATGSTGGATGSTGGTGTTPGGGTTGGTGTSGGSTTPTTSAPSVEPRSSQRVALLDVYEKGGRRVANVRVNDTVYEAVAPGDDFAGSFRLVSLDGSCGSFLFGDDRFRLCQGEEVLK